jgi:outer membrane protein OmpA-like peptidoglycan-associated protein
MNNNISRVLMGLMLLAGVGAAQAASDEEKLRELERAMNMPSDTGMPQQKRTRAIVFDNQQPSGAQAAEPAAAQVAPSSTTAAGSRDCGSLPPDVRTVGVDFAIQFNAGSATVSAASEGTLNQIAKVLALSPDRCVIVEGHTDVAR